MRTIFNPEHLSEYKQALENSLLEKVKANALFHQFCSVYLKSLTPKCTQNETDDSLHRFLKKRFKRFIDVIESPSPNYLEVSAQKDSHSYYIELICKDTQYLIFTLENIFSEFGITVTKIFHPLLSITKNKNGKIILLDTPKKDAMLASATYIEFELEDPAPTFLADLKKELERRLKAVHTITEDHDLLMKHLIAVQKEVSENPTPIKEFHSEWVELLDWLYNENFSFFGYAEFTIHKQKNRTVVTTQSERNLGLLNESYLSFVDSPLLGIVKGQVKQLASYRSPFIFDRIRFQSPVKRSEDLMRLSLKIPVEKNKWVEYNFIGLLKRSSLLTKNLTTPIIKLKIMKIIKNKHFWPGSHSYNQTIRFLNNVPKFELFRTATENLQQLIENLMSITNPNDIYCFTRKKIDKTKLFLMVVIPNACYSTQNCDAILNYLKTLIPHTGHEYFSVPSEQFYRLHFYFDQSEAENTYPNTTLIEEKIMELVKPWEQLLKDELFKQYPKKEAAQIYDTYHDAFPPHHKTRRSPAQTVSDIQFLERSSDIKQPTFDLVPFTYQGSLLEGKALLLLIYHSEKIDLFRFIPIFQNLKLYFFDELTTRVGAVDRMSGYIHAFRITHLENETDPIDIEAFRPKLVDLLSAIFTGKLPNDPLNGLLSTALLDWKAIYVIQAYRNYLMQLNPSYTKQRIDNTLLKHAKPIQIFVRYFREKFAYNKQQTPSKKQLSNINSIAQEFIDSLQDVADINDDYILRWLFNLVQHTLRCNYHQHELETSQALSFKFDCTALKIPEPRPYREIFVFSPDVEGIHIRFGSVSRGGIRWSSRANDYRSEVLGLSSTQRVKNVVIVPNGSKGCFYIKKQLPKHMMVEESKKQYQSFIQGLLSVTDNYDSKNKVIPPAKTVCYDPADPYLVVAADKGTATFSDLANSISMSNNFWLDDAFASGGSHGYSHKDLGITAKGAWECVKLHFLERGKDINKEPFTCVGIGDMSGDVFGNGMLLSKQTKLIGAFNHMHIFIDPDPDPAQSWKERERLFNLPKSAWTDYSSSILSKGGAVYERAAKVITVTKEIQTLLGLETDTLNGEELIHALLQLNAELLWFGGIGTYIKSDNETHFSVGDISNNSVRINHSQCKASIIGEGANLGITQQARLQLSESGVSLNTDFIDNSAGVNISDYEVNIKIFLQQLKQSKKIKTLTQRNSILESATDDVIQKVLANNISQHQLLSLEEVRSKHAMSRYITLINNFIKRGLINVKTDSIPSTAEFEDFKKKKSPLPRPLLALLQSLIKLEVSEQLLESSELESPLFEDLFLSYFPKGILSKYKKELLSHPLRKEITVTELTNSIINKAGTLFFIAVHEITNRSITDIAVTYHMLSSLFNCDFYREKITSSTIPSEAKHQQLLEIETILKAAVIDALLIPKQAFSLSNINDIQALFKQFKSIPFEIKRPSFFDQLKHDSHFVTFLIVAPHLSTTKHNYMISQVESIYKYFKFDKVLHCLNTISLDNEWEVEEYKLLQEMLSSKKLSIVSTCLKKTKHKKPLTEEEITSQFKPIIYSFKENLELILQLETLSMSSLTVLINKLNMI